MRTLGLRLDRDPSPRLRGLLAELSRWCHVEVAPGGADAWLCTSPDDLPPDGSGVVVDEESLPEGAVDVAAIPWMPPFVRQRWRRRYGLPEPLVLALDDVPADVAETAVALSSALVVGGDRVLEAMAWGTPVVTDEASAGSVGARPGEHVEMGGLDEAHVLAADPRRAARLSRAARRFVEERHDVAAVAFRLAVQLGLAEVSADPAWSPVRLRLDELRTPVRSRVGLRAEEMVAVLRDATRR